jgi:hypothetical protein
MPNEVEENVTPENEPEKTEPNQEEEVEEATETSELDALKKENETLRKQKEHWREKANKPTETPEAPTPVSSMQEDDLLYIAKADIHEDDLGELKEVMEKLGKTAKEAHSYLAPRFSLKAEERNTAQATATKSARGVKPTTGEDLLQRAEETNLLPETEAGMRKLAQSRLARRKGS